MNFTREPIIETIISAKEGYKLSIKSSKGGATEEHLVDAVEVVSFGGTFFYRSGERAKAFFLPASDFEIYEVRETRLLIKQPSIEKSIKIGGGKEASSRKREEQAKPEGEEAKEGEGVLPEESAKPEGGKRDRRRHRRGRRGTEETRAPAHGHGQQSEQTEARAEGEQASPPPVLSHLLQPPEGLISDSLKKYKKSDDGIIAPGASEELSSHLEKGVSGFSAPLGSDGPATDPELISEPPTRDDFHEPLYSTLDDSDLPPGIE